MTVELKIDADFHPVLQEFIQKTYEVVNASSDEKEITSQVAPLLQSILKTDGLLHEKYFKTIPTKNKNYKIYVAPNNSFSIALAVFVPGQGTPIHDHNTWGVIGIIDGMEIQTDYHHPKMGEKGRLKYKDVHFLEAGNVRVCCTTDQDLHDVR